MQVIILGPPGVGKGTQSLLISQKLGLIHLSTGEILRSAAEAKTRLGLQAKEIMNSGKLVSDEIMVGIVRDALSGNEMKNKGFILDGFPRTLNQAIALDEIFKEFGFNDVRIVNIIADDEVLLKRLMGRGRQDDTLETVTNRLKVYKEQTAPVREYYSKEYPVHDINGVGDIDKINNGIVDVLKGTGGTA
ncbi:MAG: adenylate kinase [Ignavibacteria bacterium]